MEPNYNSESTENYTCCDSTSIASLTSQDPTSTDSLDGSTTHEHLTTIMYELTTENERPRMSDFQTDPSVDESSSFPTTEHFTQSMKTTVSDNVTSSTTMKSTCDSLWPINATGN